MSRQVEFIVRNKISEWFGIEFPVICDKYFLLSGFRPDIVINRPRRASIIVEIDENQHKNLKKDDEISRMEIINKQDPRNTIFIRFNPDGFKINAEKELERKYQSKCKKIVSSIEFPIEKRLEILKAEVERWISEPFSEIFD